MRCVPNNDTLRILHRVGLRIVELRTGRGLTQEELAEKVGVSPRQIQRVEAGLTDLNVSALATLGTGLRCNISDLFDAPSRATHRRTGRPRKRAKSMR